MDEMNKMRVKLTFVEDVLGSTNNNPEVFEEFHAPKAPPENVKEERAAILGDQPTAVEEGKEVVEKMTTVFPRNADGSRFCFDYQIRGLFKEGLGVACELDEEVVKCLSKWSAKATVDQMLFVEERRVPFISADGKPITAVKMLERPLRAQTMRGERICLARSEVIPAGSSITFTVAWFDNQNKKSKKIITEDQLVWVLNYGRLKGFGQWRGSGGFGRFTWERLDAPVVADKAA